MKSILVTGASGYVGGRLLRKLCVRSDLKTVALARNPDFFIGRVQPKPEIRKANVLELSHLIEALQGIDIAYYLIHSMDSKESFSRQDRTAAENFAKASKANGVKKIIYLGGLGSGSQLSEHLKSRQEVGEILRASGICTIEFRASVIIGSGSLSFELIRAIVDRLPVLITPSWVRTKTQPISIESVLAYLEAALEEGHNKSMVYEIGGNDQVSYEDLFREYARQRGLRRYILRVPVLTPKLSSLWLGLVTPVYARIGREMIDGLRNETVVSDPSAMKDFSIRPGSVREAIERALLNEDREIAETHWIDALSSKRIQTNWGGEKIGSKIVDSRSVFVPVPKDKAFSPIQSIGGENGWYFANWLWKVRGWIDLLWGGVGIRRGRRHPSKIYPGDPIDFWRVEKYAPQTLLRLSAEMKVPGRAWLQFEVQEGEEGSSRIIQTAIFEPRGLLGLLYWYLLYPIHLWIFQGMLRSIAKKAISA